MAKAMTAEEVERVERRLDGLEAALAELKPLVAKIAAKVAELRDAQS